MFHVNQHQQKTASWFVVDDHVIIVDHTITSWLTIATDVVGMSRLHWHHHQPAMAPPNRYRS